MTINHPPEGMGIGEWVILFSENFEGKGMGRTIRKNFARERNLFFGIASQLPRRGSLRQKITICLGDQVSRK